jgi:class 3 adenylate cyclase
MATERAVERRVVSVLFADLVGFTSLSEELDAEDVTLVQDAYFEAVRETVARHGGQLEKFVGDAAMAVFGAPRVRDDDAERAVRAGSRSWRPCSASARASVSRRALCGCVWASRAARPSTGRRAPNAARSPATW